MRFECSPNSTPINFLLIFNAVAAVVPEPKKESSKNHFHQYTFQLFDLLKLSGFFTIGNCTPPSLVKLLIVEVASQYVTQVCFSYIKHHQYFHLYHLTKQKPTLVSFIKLFIQLSPCFYRF